MTNLDGYGFNPKLKAAVEGGFTREIVLLSKGTVRSFEGREYAMKYLRLLVNPGTILFLTLLRILGGFTAWDLDTQEYVRVEGWKWRRVNA